MFNGSFLRVCRILRFVKKLDFAEYTIGTVFIQGPSILLLVWRSIIFNGSFLCVCRILWFVKKFDFAFLSQGGPCHGARGWCLGRVPKHRNHWQEVGTSGKK